MLSLHLEDGMYESGIVFIAFCMGLVPWMRSISMSAAVESVLSPLLATGHATALQTWRRRRRNLRWLYGVLLAAHTAPVLFGLVVFCILGLLPYLWPMMVVVFVTS